MEPLPGITSRASPRRIWRRLEARPRPAAPPLPHMRDLRPRARSLGAPSPAREAWRPHLPQPRCGEVDLRPLPPSAQPRVEASAPKLADSVSGNSEYRSAQSRSRQADGFGNGPTACRVIPSIGVRTHPPRARARARRRPPINPSACRVGLRVSARARRGRHERAHRSALALDSQSSSVTSGAPTFNLPTLCRQVRRAAAWGVTPCSRPR